MKIRISLQTTIAIEDIINLYKANNWSAANKPEKLHQALQNSDYLVSAWEEHTLIGLGSRSLVNGFLIYQ